MERIARLTYAWTLFAEDPGGRILVWQLSSRELRIAEAFVKVEETEHGVTPDLFLYFDDVFTDPDAYVRSLAAYLTAWWRSDREELQGFLPNWTPPPVWDLPSLVALASSIVRALPTPLRHIVWVLQPSSPPPPAAWRQWLTTLAEGIGAAPLRILVLEAKESSALSELVAPQIRREEVDLDYDGMAAELAASMGPDGPGKDYRIAYTAILSAASRDDLPTLETAARRALEICKAESWPGLAVAIHLASAVAYQRVNRSEDCIAAYNMAAASAAEATAAGDSNGPRLHAYAVLGLAGALFSWEKLVEAAQVAERAIPLAAATDPNLAMEAARIAAEAWSRAGKAREAWRAAQPGLVFVKDIPAAERRRTTLPYFGVLLLKLADSLGESVRDWQVQLDAWMEPGWEKELPP